MSDSSSRWMNIWGSFYVPDNPGCSIHSQLCQTFRIDMRLVGLVRSLQLRGVLGRGHFQTGDSGNSPAEEDFYAAR